MSSGKWWPFCLGLDVLINCYQPATDNISFHAEQVPWGDQGLALLTLSLDKNWDSHSLVNGYPSFYPRIALVAPSPELQVFI